MCVFEQLIRTLGLRKLQASAAAYCRVACIHSFAALVDMCICISFCTLCMQVELVSPTLIRSLALLPAALPATARASAPHSSMLYLHSTLVLSTFAINCRSVELIVERIVVFSLSSSNSTDG